MKKLITILTTVSLLAPTTNTIVSCNNQPKYIPYDDSGQITKDVETMNNSKNKVSKHFQTY